MYHCQLNQTQQHTRGTTAVCSCTSTGLLVVTHCAVLCRMTWKRLLYWATMTHVSDRPVAALLHNVSYYGQVSAMPVIIHQQGKHLVCRQCAAAHRLQPPESNFMNDANMAVRDTCVELVLVAGTVPTQHNPLLLHRVHHDCTRTPTGITQTQQLSAPQQQSKRCAGAAATTAASRAAAGTAGHDRPRAAAVGCPWQ